MRLAFIVEVAFYIVLYILLKTVKQAWVMSLGLVPLVIFGLLLGIWIPPIIALVNYKLTDIMLESMHLPGENTIGELLYLLYALGGMAAGRLGELTVKLRRSEESMRRARDDAEEANRSKSEFLACMSHEIRTPMNSIIGFANLLKEDISDRKHREKLDIIVEAGDSLLNLINDILDFSKIEAGKLEWSNKDFVFRELFTPVKNIFSLKAQDHNLNFEINFNGPIPEIVSGDSGRIQQIIINLVSNAFKFTNKGSIIVDCSYEENIFIIKVSDTGIGIPEDKLESVFFAFSQVDSSITRQYKGTGLGLAITRQLVTHMGGSIIVESILGKGSAFTVRLPLKVVAFSGRSIPPCKPEERNPRFLELIKKTIFQTMEDKEYNILVAEDNDLNREFLAIFLQRLNLSCDFAGDGSQTLELLTQSLKNGKKYDLLLLDMQMPLLSGLDVIKYIRESLVLKDLYVITLTANAIKGDAQKYLAAGCDDYIPKPIDTTLLLEKLYVRLRERFQLPDISPRAMMEGEVNFSINQDQKKLLEKITAELKDLYEFFNPQAVEKLKPRIEQLLPPELYEDINLKLDESIRNYDDEILLDIIVILNKLVIT